MARLLPPRVYAESPVFFNVIKRERGLWRDSLKVLLAAQRGDIKLVASTLVLAEIGGWRGDIDQDAQDHVISEYLEQGDVEWVEVDLFVVREARRLARQYNLRGADAVHLATAVRREAHYFMSRDLAYPYGQRVGGVEVRLPEVVWHATIDDLQVDADADAEDAQQDMK